MLSIFYYDRTSRTGQSVPADQLLQRREEWKKAGTVVWIDLSAPTAEEEDLVFKDFFPVHPLTLEDATRLRREPKALPHFPKVEEFRDYLFVIVNPLTEEFLSLIREKRARNHNRHDRASTQLSAMITANMLVTHHYEPLACVNDLQAYLARHGAEADRGPDYLFHLLLDATVDQYAVVLDHVDDSLDELEIRMFRKPTPQLFEKLLRLKREIVALRKTLVYEREVLARLIRKEFALIDEREMAYYRNVYDHLVRFSELIESSREMVTDLMQTHLAAASNKLNEIMKVLTIISTVILPMTLVAGVYGMNFETLPELHWRYGYAFSLVLMGLVGVASLLFFKWKKWI